ncbi:TPA: ATP-binding protein [Streptococcus agalactiae]|uniref:ATP-binding protein n=2 Tax=Streptococcus agalactiae TaxID=1311 RepID=UPI000F5DCA38|nr:ATP-binding protein [Streptococcus agalactiae]RRA76198.1 ATP-binding protein [Streptococcus agalactiae]HEO6662939.1 ATP-binding protein [Streptococcus agalactiae]HEO6667010.1 ATP-binding protein [Streptococcus agalactiae]HEO6675204.1 ATP-binding protein [Streptococcus agalactiae]HEO6687593.1 ATP-binding protein [Streptococcus agalactiae]
MVLLQKMGAIGDGTRNGMLSTGFLIDTKKTCEIHQAPIYRRTRPIGTESEFCWACQQEEINKKKSMVDLAYQNQAMLADGYSVFKRESILSKEIATAEIKNFKVECNTDNNALNFAKRTIRDYIKGMEGNCILQGPPGVGKSHLSMSIAKNINELFKSYNQIKSVIFVSVPLLTRHVKDTFNYKDKESKFSQERMTNVLTNCDYLILDDLGKESTTGNIIKSASEWTYTFLFNILDNRQNTIINTNFTTKELTQIYDRAFVDRITKGAKKNIFVFPEDTESKRF